MSRKLRDEYDRLEGALKKLGVEPDCSNTEEEDGYNAESDMEEEEEGEKHRQTDIYTMPAPSIYQHRHPGHLDRVDEVGTWFFPFFKLFSSCAAGSSTQKGKFFSFKDLTIISVCDYVYDFTQKMLQCLSEGFSPFLCIS